MNKLFFITQRLLLVYCLLIFLVSCNNSKNIYSNYSYPEPPVVELTEINSQLKISLAFLERLINQNIGKNDLKPANFYESGFEIKEVSLTKFDDVKLNTQNGALLWNLPLRLKAQVLPTEGNVLKSLIKPQNIDISMNINLQTYFEISKNYEVQIFGRVNGISWLNEPNLKFGPIKLNLATIIQYQISNLSPVIFQEVSKALNNQIKLQVLAQKHWYKLQQPKSFNINRYTGIAQITGNKLALGKPVSNGSYLVFPLKFTGFCNAVLSENEQLIEISKLPELTSLSNYNNTSQVNLLAKITINDFNKLLKKQVQNKIYYIDNKPITIDSVLLFAHGPQVGLFIQTKGSVKFSANFYGSPVFNEATNMLQLQNVTFKLKTNNLRTKLYVLFKKKKFTNKIIESVSFDFSQLNHLISDKINNINFSDSLLQNSQIKATNLQTVPKCQITKEAIYLHLNTTGNFDLEIN